MIDRKFQFVAVNPCNGKFYTERNAIVLCAKDKAVIPALSAYLLACKDLDCNKEHIESVKLLIQRVMDYQVNIKRRVPDTIGECEINRCVNGIFKEE